MRVLLLPVWLWFTLLLALRGNCAFDLRCCACLGFVAWWCACVLEFGDFWLVCLACVVGFLIRFVLIARGWCII